MTSADSLQSFPLLPRDEDGPVFAEPWQAQAFAVVVRFIETGKVSQSEWTTRLASSLKEAALEEANDSAAHYYEHWLRALEQLVLEKNLASQLDLQEEQDNIEANDKHN